MARRPCLGCGRATTGARCPTCQQAHDAQRWQAKSGRYNGAWRRTSRDAIAAHRAQHGDICPGWKREPHPATDWVTDHDVGPLCRSCNAVKAATFDKERRGSGGGAATG